MKMGESLLSVYSDSSTKNIFTSVYRLAWPESESALSAFSLWKFIRSIQVWS